MKILRKFDWLIITSILCIDFYAVKLLDYNKQTANYTNSKTNVNMKTIAKKAQVNNIIMQQIYKQFFNQFLNF